MSIFIAFGAKPRTTIRATEKNTSHFVGRGLGCLCLRAQGSLVVPCSG